jgi:hypothetical protein
MAYERDSNSGNPTLFMILLDQSGSMADPWVGDPGAMKDTALADIVNRLIAELAKNCLGGGVVRDRLHLCILGYGGSNTVRPAWGGNLEAREVVPISEVEANPVDSVPRPIKTRDGDGNEVELVKKVNIWITPKSDGGTPMAEAFARARTIVEEWIADPSYDRKAKAFPPIVCNITDGVPNDEQAALEASKQIRDLATEDGSVLLINIHVSDITAGDTTAAQYGFEVDESELPPSDKHAPFLFKASSTIPDELRERAQAAGLQRVRKGSRLLIGNADAAAVIGLLNFASKASQAST